MTLLTVLRSGGIYNASHVDRLRAQLAGQMKMATISDVPCANRIPMKYNYPGWWAKMELFRPDFRGNFLYLDLDSHILDDITSFAAVTRTTILNDFYRNDMMQSSLMYVTDSDRARIWNAWEGSEETIMESYRHKRAGFNGDQNFIQAVLDDSRANVDRWRNVRPGAVISYKVDVIAPRSASATAYPTPVSVRRDFPDARVIIFHGKPRPWDVGF